MLKVCSNASALGGESWTSSPMKRTGAVLKEVASAARAGASRLHGAHQEPQKLSTTTLPRCAARLNFAPVSVVPLACGAAGRAPGGRSEEHTSELQSQSNLVCRLLLEKKKQQINTQFQVPKNKKKKYNEQ